MITFALDLCVYIYIKDGISFVSSLFLYSFSSFLRTSSKMESNHNKYFNGKGT